jgi:hypothetical protein
MIKRKKIGPYIYDKLTGTFSGFLIGMWASGLVSHFFETKSFKNLWGLTAKKTLVSKNTFGYLEWFAAALIGYIVFEIAMKYLKKDVVPRTGQLRFKILRLAVKNGYQEKLRGHTSWFR